MQWSLTTRRTFARASHIYLLASGKPLRTKSIRTILTLIPVLVLQLTIPGGSPYASSKPCHGVAADNAGEIPTEISRLMEHATQILNDHHPDQFANITTPD